MPFISDTQDKDVVDVDVDVAISIAISIAAAVGRCSLLNGKAMTMAEGLHEKAVMIGKLAVRVTAKIVGRWTYNIDIIFVEFATAIAIAISLPNRSQTYNSYCYKYLHPL